MIKSYLSFLLTLAVLANWFSATAAIADQQLAIVDVAAGRTETFSQGDLMAMPQETYETSTIWTKGEKTFTGPTLAAVLDAVNAGDGPVTLFAINDYSVEIPRDTITDDAPIVALSVDENPLSVRDKGPLWVVFPYDSDVRYRSENIFAYSIWQLVRIEVGEGD